MPINARANIPSMKTEAPLATCPCNNCSGHIQFEVIQAGQTVECPHCKLETLLFIPPSAIPPKLPAPVRMGKIPAMVAVSCILVAGIIIAAVCFMKKSSKQMNAAPVPSSSEQAKLKTSPTQIESPNLKPVSSAFGWKLGDKFAGHGTTYEFTPEVAMPPFNHFHLSLTEDGRIAQVSAQALNIEEDPYDCKRRLVSLLTEKYGLRLHDPNETEGESYYFGTRDSTAHLQISKNGFFTLDFYDDHLYGICCDEYNARIKKQDANKTAPLSKQLQ